MPRRLALLTVLLASLVPAAARAQEFAPVDRPGPSLDVPVGRLDTSLTCSASGVDHASRAPVLLVPATGSTAAQNWSGTYEPALDRLGIGWCALDVPGNSRGDIQDSAQYIVHAIRTMFARAGRPIAIIGHSQGGMSPRVALRFWPDVRPMVDDLISFAAPNHGSTIGDTNCRYGCAPAEWQQRSDANLIRAVNSVQETFPGISYTDVYTRTDEVVRPDQDDHGSSSLHGGGGAITNVATQDVCPADPYEHLLIGLVDPVAYALAVDALDHPGPADRSRLSPLVCALPFPPALAPPTARVAGTTTATPRAETRPGTVSGEPPLRCWVLAAGCGSPPAAPACLAPRVTHVGVRVLRGARATAAGHRVRLRRAGRRLLATVDLRAARGRTVILRVRGRDARGRRVTVTRTLRACG